MSAPTLFPDACDPLDALIEQLAATSDAATRTQLLATALADVDHERFFTRLKDASEQARTRDIAASLRLAELLIQGAQQAAVQTHQAMGLMARGDALRAKGDFAAALTCLDDAGSLFLALNDEVSWARTRIGWILTANALGQGAAALAVVDRARAVLTQAGMWLRVGILELNTGTVLRTLGRYEQALGCYTRARAAFGQLGAAGVAQLAAVDVNTANVLTHLGEFHAALQMHEDARQRWLERGELVRVAWQDYNCALVLDRLGYYTRALQRYGASVAALRRTGFPFEAALNTMGMTECYLHLNLFPQARDHAEAALAVFEEFRTPAEAAYSRLVAALAYLGGGDIRRGAPLLREATAGFRAGGQAEGLVLGLIEQARLAVQQGDWPAALALATEAQTLGGQHGLAIRRAQADLLWARAALGTGDLAGAAATTTAVLELAEQRQISQLAPEGHALLGAIAERRGELKKALLAYEQAIASIEQLQQFLAIDLRLNYLADKRQIYDAAIRLSLDLQRPQQAFAHLERAKSRALFDYLASDLDVQSRTRPTDPAQVAELSRLRADHHWLSRQRYDLALLSNATTVAPTGDADLARKIADLEGQITRLTEQLALDRTEGLVVPGLPAPQPAADLAPGEVLLEYYLRDTASTVFVVTHDDLQAVPLAVSATAVERLLRGWQMNLAMAARAIVAGTPLTGLAAGAQATLHALYRALVAPVAAHLDGCTRLVVVPDGPLQAVPFQALFDGERYLIEQVELAFAPSSGLLRLCRTRAQRNAPTTATPQALVLAYDYGGALPYVMDEARAVAALLPGALYLGDEATLATLREVAPQYPILHLAAHGEARLDNPLFAHLALADGQLGTSDLFNLDLSGTLVVLSGCETGRALVTAGDELIGLSRGFLYAGAATLVQSLWRVEDRATAHLMTQFYSGLVAGLTKGAALRAAQLRLLAEARTHPYFWAPFQLFGDSGSLVGAAA